MNTPTSESNLSDPVQPGLYIVAVPIGNLGDITIRAIDVLRSAAIIACEDTRVTGKLLKAHAIDTRMQRYDDHASDQTRGRLIERAAVEAVALVSDAGTPLVSDPGYRLVKEAREAGIAVTTLPGPCAAIAGLTLAGLPNDRFLFGGFLPVKDKARADILTELGAVQATVIFYETGPRLVRSLDAIANLWPGRVCAVARELTKLHEECRTGEAAQLARHYNEHPPKGEIVLLVGPPDASQSAELSEADADDLLRAALQEMSVSKAAGKVAKTTGLDRQNLYSRAVELRREDAG